MLGRGLEKFRNICARRREKSGLRGSGMVRVGRRKCKVDGETGKKKNEMRKLFEIHIKCSYNNSQSLERIYLSAVASR